MRRIITASQQLMNRCLLAEDEPEAILAGAEESILQLGDSRAGKGLLTPVEIIENYEGGINAFLDPSKRSKASAPALQNSMR